jgi:hypothetical protein
MSTLTIEYRRRLTSAAVRHGQASIKVLEAYGNLIGCDRPTMTAKRVRLWKAYERMSAKSDILFDGALKA